MLIRTVLLASLVSGVLSSAVGCSDAKNVITCADVCNRYKDCFNKDYDVSSCTNSCQADAGKSSNAQQRLDDCDACIGEKSCVSAAFNCATECAGVIAQ